MLLINNDNLELVVPNVLTNDTRYEYYKQLAITHYQELINNYNLESRPYQPEMAAIYALRDRNICAGSCGLGKTLIVGLLICILYKQWTRPGQIQIAVPSLLSATSRWLVDLNKLSPLHNLVDVINSEKDMLKSDKPIWVYTLDFIKRKSKTYETISKHLCKRYKASLLVIDEIHLLKPNSARSTQWELYIKQVKRFIGLSGTLSDGRLDLFHHILKLTYGRHFKYTVNEFIERFGARRKIKSNYLRGEEEVENLATRYLSHLCITKLAEFATISNQFIHRVSLNDPAVKAVVSIPSHTNHLLEILPVKDHRNDYIQLVLESRQKLDKLKNTNNMNLAFNCLHPLMKASAWPENTKNNKLSKLLELVENNSGKTVIFANLIETGRRLYDHLSLIYPEQVIRLYATDHDTHPIKLSADRREELLSKFLFDESIKVGIFSINLAAESIDLNVANQVIFYDYPWQALKIQQAIHRAVRPGSPVNHVDIYYLVNHGMIDQHQYNLIKEKSIGSKLMLEFNQEDLSQIDYAPMDVTALVQKTLEVETINNFKDTFKEIVDGTT